MTSTPRGPAETGRTGEEPSKTTGAAAFRHRDFRLYFFGKVFASIALHMVTVAVGYQVYDMTGRPMDLAYIGLSVFAPAIGFCLITGYVSDLYDRRLVLAVCYAVMMVAAVLFVAFTLSGTTAAWPAFLIMSVMGVGRAFYQPASTSFVPNLVHPAEFPNAVAWNTAANKVSQVIGPSLGGGLYLLGPAVVYAVAAVSLLFGIVTTVLIHTRTHRTGREPVSFATLFAGLRYVFEKKILFGAITLDLFVVFLGGVTALIPIYAKDILAVGPSGAGLLRSAAAFGAVLSAVALTQISLNRAVGKILFTVVFVFGAATIVFGISKIFWLSMAAMSVIGASDMISVYIRSTLLQIATPDQMRGRVSAVNSIFTGTSNEIGEFRAGTMAAFIGTVPAVVAGGIGSILVAAACSRLFPVLLRVERMDRDLLEEPSAGR